MTYQHSIGAAGLSRLVEGRKTPMLDESTWFVIYFLVMLYTMAGTALFVLANQPAA